MLEIIYIRDDKLEDIEILNRKLILRMGYLWLQING